MSIDAKWPQRREWVDTVQQWLAQQPVSKRNAMRKYLLDERLAGWKLILPSVADGYTLLLGGKYYSTALHLSRMGKGVIVYDTEFETLNLPHQMACRASIDNIRCVLGESVVQLPFSSASFDLVIVNGLLHSRPEFIAHDSWDRQRQCLDEVRRVLRPEGICYLGCENQSRYHQLRDNQEPLAANARGAYLYQTVSKIRALFLMMFEKGGAVQSLDHYTRLLHEACFDERRIFALSPHLDHLSEVAALSDAPATPEMGTAHRIGRRACIGNRDQIAPAYGIVAGTEAPKPLYEKIWQCVVTDLRSVGVGGGAAASSP
jgi:SAM-dependent methyltransferase